MTHEAIVISNRGINPAAEIDPTRAVMRHLAGMRQQQAAEMEAGAKHEPVFHSEGWSLAIETPLGVVGLWSCWLGNQFYLGYPQNVPTEFQARIDQMIREVLEVELAEPVLQVDATAVNDDNYEGEYKDSDKPLETNSCGQIVAYRTRRQVAFRGQQYGEPLKRLWAKYYAPRLEGDNGRVWVDHSAFDSYCHTFHLVKDDSPTGLELVHYGHHSSMGISTYQFSMWNKYAPDGPTTKPEAVQAYREKFLELACRLARLMGGASAVNIDYGLVIAPAQLGQLGYTDATWLQRETDHLPGILRARKIDADDHEETIILQSGNNMVPWSAIRRLPCSADLTSGQLLAYLTF